VQATNAYSLLARDSDQLFFSCDADRVYGTAADAEPAPSLTSLLCPGSSTVPVEPPQPPRNETPEEKTARLAEEKKNRPDKLKGVKYADFSNLDQPAEVLYRGSGTSNRGGGGKSSAMSPTSAPADEKKPGEADKDEQGHGWYKHVVTSSDTLAGLRIRYKCTLRELKQFNDFPGENFLGCDILRIPKKHGARVEAMPQTREQKIIQFRVDTHAPDRMDAVCYLELHDWDVAAAAVAFAADSKWEEAQQGGKDKAPLADKSDFDQLKQHLEATSKIATEALAGLPRAVVSASAVLAGLPVASVVSGSSQAGGGVVQGVLQGVVVEAANLEQALGGMEVGGGSGCSGGGGGGSVPVAVAAPVIQL
jgi:hypothetical protein